MEIKKMVDRDSLTPEELEALDSGDKTEEDLLSDWEAQEAEAVLKITEEAKKAKELADNYKIRAEKAEAKAKGKDPEIDPPKNELSQSDLIYLAKSDIHEDDIEEVLNIAKTQNKSLKEVHTLGWVKSYLSEKKEERATAEATSTGNSRSGTKSLSDEELIQGARQGKEVPAEKLAEARFKKM